jgi:hypothetical protein
MTTKSLVALAGILALSVSNVYADDDKQKPKKPAAPSELILSQSDDEPKKPKKPKGEAPELQQIVAQSDEQPKKPKKPEGADLLS